MLAWPFVREFSDRLAKPTTAHRRRVDGRLVAGHAWPGNVRDWAASIERATILTRGPSCRWSRWARDRPSTLGVDVDPQPDIGRNNGKPLDEVGARALCGEPLERCGGASVALVALQQLLDGKLMTSAPDEEVAAVPPGDVLVEK